MSDRPIHEVLAEISAKVPPEEWAKLDKTHYADPDTLATLAKLERENAALRHDVERHVKIASDLATELEAARKDAVPVADILASAAHVAENGAAVARFGGQYEHEGRCRELCAMYLRELVGAFRLKQQFAAIDAAIAQGKEKP